MKMIIKIVLLYTVILFFTGCENNEDALYLGVKSLLRDPKQLAYYKMKAIQRGKTFSTENTVEKVENMLTHIMDDNHD